MNKHFAAILLLFIQVGSSFFAQNATPLPPELLLPTLERAKKLSFQNLDSALLLARQVLAVAVQLDSAGIQFKAQRSIGILLEDHNQYEAARQAYAEALRLAETRLSVRDRLNIFTDWAIVHKKMGDFETARHYHLRTIELGTQHRDWEMVENGWHGLGTMFSMLSDFDESARCYLASIEAAEKWGNRAGITLSQQNLANIYMKAKNYPMAERNIEIAHRMAQELGDSVRLATVLKIWGNIEIATGQLDLALEKHRAALQIFEKRYNKPQQSESWLALADIFFQQNKMLDAASALEKCGSFETFFSPYSHAAFHRQRGKLLAAQGQPVAAAAAFETSLAKTEKFGFKEIARENHLDLAKIFHQMHRDADAYRHALAANELNETIFAADKQRAMTEAKFKFDVAQRDHQIQLQGQQLQRSFWWRVVLGGGLCLVFGLFLFSRQQKNLKQRALARSEILMKELHHRVKNNLQTITSLMRMQARQVADPAVLAVLNENRSRLEMIAHLHQQLYRNDSVRAVNLQIFAADLLEKLRFTYGFSKIELDAQVEIEPQTLDVDTALPLALILNELLTNAFKYALPHAPEPPQLHISFNGKILRVSDNGPGLPAPSADLQERTFGFQLIRSLSEQLKGSFRFFNQDGVHFELRLGARAG